MANPIKHHLMQYQVLLIYNLRDHLQYMVYPKYDTHLYLHQPILKHHLLTIYFSGRY